MKVSPGERDARPTDVRSNKSVALPVCFKHLSDEMYEFYLQYHAVIAASAKTESRCILFRQLTERLFNVYNCVLAFNISMVERRHLLTEEIPFIMSIVCKPSSSIEFTSFSLGVLSVGPNIGSVYKAV